MAKIYIPMNILDDFYDYFEYDGHMYKMIEKNCYDHGRWEAYYDIIMQRDDGKYFSTTYSEGLTELQDSSGFSESYTHEGTVEFTECKRVEKTVYEYVPIDKS